MVHDNSTTLARVIVAAVVSALLVGGTAAAAADDTENRSYPGCPLLLEGQTSDCIVRLKTELNAVNPPYDLTENGVFDADTRIAVLDFQEWCPAEWCTTGPPRRAWLRGVGRPPRDPSF